MKTASRSFLGTGAILWGSLLLVTLACPSAGATGKPNIVLLVADDLGWGDVSFHGDEVRTPNLDRLVAEGAELRRFYVSPVCTPTRAGLMTGRYPIRFGLMRSAIPAYGTSGMSPDESTFADALSAAGYENRGIFGKWHLGQTSLVYHPLQRGFTELVGHYTDAIDYFDHTRYNELDWHRGYESDYTQGYSTDLIADAAVDFIARHAGADSPFLCYVPFNAPHTPLQALEEDLESYAALAELYPDEEPVPGDPKRKVWKGEGDSQRQTLAAMITRMDHAIGRILDALDENHVADNTLVWFFSDNGGKWQRDNRPLRGKKGSVFEGGIRVPAVVRWPGHVPPGSVIESPIAYIDVLPTLLAAVGPVTHTGKALDGINVMDILEGKRATLNRSLYSYVGYLGEDKEEIALTEKGWKLIVTGLNIIDPGEPAAPRQTYLFRIDQDPYERANLASENPGIVEEMSAKLEQFRNLQPPDAMPPYHYREGPFQAPPEWRIPEN